MPNKFTVQGKDLETRIAEYKLRMISRIKMGGGECWEWPGARLLNGYGVGVVSLASLGMRPKSFYAHRVAYEHWTGTIPEGMTIDHLCRNKGCVNPAHLEVVTLAENISRAHAKAPDDPCPQGHPAEWQRTAQGRRCAACHRARESARHARKRQLA